MKLSLIAFAGFLITAVLLLSNTDQPQQAEAVTYASITSGTHNACALVASPGAVRCWGWNLHGELGLGTASAPYTLSRVALPVCASGVWNGSTCNGGSAYTAYALSSGSSAAHTCAQVIYLIVQCWGFNTNGQVGNGSTSIAVTLPATVQCQGSSSYCVSNVLAGIGVVATGDGHTCAVDFGGYVWCWGRNTSGQLGDGTTTNRSYATRVCATGSGQDCTGGSLLSGVYAVSAGLAHTCAYMASGGVQCWGYNEEGQLGDGTTTNRSLPVAVSGLSSGVASIAVGDRHSCALLTSVGAKCWGMNDLAALGDGTQTARTTPASVCATGAWNGSSCNGGSVLSGISKLTAGGGHTCALMTSAPYVKCWGTQAFGQLGNSVQSFGEFKLNPVPWTVPGWGSPQPSALSAGGLHTCMLLSGFPQCWGWNLFGQLGNNSVADTTSWIGHDTDKDGCIDAYELGPNHAQGGQRDPTNFYDFFDTPNDAGVRDKIVDSSDATRIIARYYSTGTPSNNPLSTPIPTAPGYYPAFDRQDDPASGEAWDLIVGDGQITIGDVNLLGNQSGDSCATPTATLTPTPNP